MRSHAILPAGTLRHTLRPPPRPHSPATVPSLTHSHTHAATSEPRTHISLPRARKLPISTRTSKHTHPHPHLPTHPHTQTHLAVQGDVLLCLCRGALEGGEIAGMAAGGQQQLVVVGWKRMYREISVRCSSSLGVRHHHHGLFRP